MNKEDLLRRLSAADPGWPLWSALVDLVRSLEFEPVALDYVGDYVAAGTRLSFGVPATDHTFLAFAPAYVAALYEMKADDPEMAGGYAGLFNGQLAERGCLFSPAGNDVDMGFPVFDPPPGTFAFQSNASGASFFINRDLQILYPDVAAEFFSVLDSLDTFTQVCIQKVLDGEGWFSAYADRLGNLVD